MTQEDFFNLSSLLTPTNNIVHRKENMQGDPVDWSQVGFNIIDIHHLLFSKSPLTVKCRGIIWTKLPFH